MKLMLEKLNNKLSWIIHSKLFDICFGLTLLLNPIAVWIQATKIVMTATASGVSSATFGINGVVNMILFLYGVKQKDWRIVFAALALMCGAIAVVSLTYYYR